MRAFVVVVDRIYEVDGKVDDSDEFTVTSCPYGSGLNGSLFRPNRWATLKDAAYLYLEHELKLNLRRWEEIAQDLKADSSRVVDYNYALEQVKTYNTLLPQARLMDPFLLVKKQ